MNRKNSYFFPSFEPDVRFSTYTALIILYSILNYPETYKYLTARIFDKIPLKNTLLLFPSELQHKIKKNVLKEDRYSIAFNVLPIGSFNKGQDNEIIYN